MALSKLGRYDIVRVLGNGAMGTVYEAYDPHLERRVAIKTIAVQGLSEEGVRDYEIRFRTEARSCARLQHPHIVSVYDAGRDGDTAYLVMEYVEGLDLKHHLDRGERFTLDQTLRIMRELLSALAYAHAQNVVHRDVKPGNLLIEAHGRVKLSDFGVARIQDAGDATRTRGLMVGTLKYMSPEQVQGLSVDARADLFSAGIVLYQLLTARQPFVGDSEFAIIAQIVGVDPPAPSSIHPALPVAIDAVVARALAKEREQRYPTAQAFGDALALACGQANDRSAAPPPVAIGPGSGTTRTSPSASGSAGIATVTQELELVYWKDVRDSDDALDLQGFLDRFPDGIYADLARRKLRKLGVVFLGEQTVTRVEPRVAGAGLVDDSDKPMEPDQQHGKQRGRRINRLVAAWVTGAALVLVAAIGVGWWFSGPASTGSTAVQALEPSLAPVDGAAAQPTPTVTDAHLAGTPPGPATGPAGVAAQPVASPVTSDHGAAPRAAATDQRSAVAAAGAQATSRAAKTTAASSVPNDSDATPAAASPADAGGPEQACSGRVLLGYQICLSAQCAQPQFASLALCVQRRAAEQAIRQQQTNRN